MATPRTRNPRGEGDRLRRDLLEAASRLLDEHQDPAAVTLRGVATRVGITPNAVYLHFDSRDELLVYAVLSRFGRFTEQLQAVVESGADPLDKLRRGHDAYMAFARDNPGAYRAMFGHQSLNPERRDVLNLLEQGAVPTFELLVSLMQNSIDAGVFPDVDRDALSRLVWAAGHGWSDLARTPMGELLPEPGDLIDTLLALAGSGR